MSDEQWGPWIEHDQSGVPDCVRGRFIEVKCVHPSGQIDIDRFFHPVDLDEDWRNVWQNGDRHISVVTGQILVRIDAYRIRKPRGLTILENLIADIPQPVEVGG